MNWSIQGKTGGGTTKREEAGAIIQVGNGEILVGQRPSSGNGERGVSLRETEEFSLVELGDLLAGDEGEGRGLQADFQVDGTFHPAGPQRYMAATRGVVSRAPAAKSKHEAKDTNYPDATYRSSSLIRRICLQDTLL